jgi:hypothetical protein
MANVGFLFYSKQFIYFLCPPSILYYLQSIVLEFADFLNPDHFIVETNLDKIVAGR